MMNVALADRLQQDTRDLHDQLETLPQLKSLTDPGISPLYYCRALQVLLPPQRSLERALNNFYSRHWPQCCFTPRYPLLEQDLADLSPATQIPEPPAEPQIQTQAEAIGSRYVLQGSELGGQLILHHLKRHLPDSPQRFFQSATLSYKTFRQRLDNDSHLMTDNDYPAALHAARMAFTLFLDAADNVCLMRKTSDDAAV